MKQNKIKVLVVDDNEISAMLAQEILGQFGVESDSAESAEEALRKVADESYSLIFMDYVMPGTDGIEATRLISRISDAPIVAMTGETSEDIISRFIEAGAKDGIAKPINPEQLKEILGLYIPGIFRHENMDAAEQGISSEDESYYNLLKSVIKNVREYNEKLRAYLQTGDVRTVKLVAHSMKSVFANVGITQMAEISAGLEKKADQYLESDNEDGKFSDEEITEYIAEAEKACHELERCAEEYEARGISDLNKGQIVQLTALETAELIAKTMGHIERFEIDYIIDGLERLRDASAGEKKHKLVKAIEAAREFDYDMVKRTVTEISSPENDRGEAR